MGSGNPDPQFLSLNLVQFTQRPNLETGNLRGSHTVQ
jgi:hypothetical protein